ncbi:MAG: hypothetical protein AAGG51_20745 [Cyanobacteria bacterium P01_G01_bin.54]
MRKEFLVLALLLGISAPAIAPTVSLESPAIAQATLPIGQWLGGGFEVNIAYFDNALHYHGYDLRNGSSLHLVGATVSGDRSRRLYTWRNGGHRYQVAWQPNDPEVIRLQVFDPNGRQLINTLMDYVLSP